MLRSMYLSPTPRLYFYINHYLSLSIHLSEVRIDPRKNKTTLARVNAEIFGSMVRKVRHAAGTANKSLPSILIKRRSIQEAASSIDQTISEMNLAVDVDDYRVLPGGHWIPLSCRPLWKVSTYTWGGGGGCFSKILNWNYL